MPQHKSVARQMSNWRPLQSRASPTGPGGAFSGSRARVDEVIMSPGNSFYLVFGNGGYLRVYNAAFAKVFDSGNVLPWTTATAKTSCGILQAVGLHLRSTAAHPDAAASGR
jgi:hypothetical protein